MLWNYNHVLVSSNIYIITIFQNFCPVLYLKLNIRAMTSTYQGGIVENGDVTDRKVLLSYLSLQRFERPAPSLPLRLNALPAHLAADPVSGVDECWPINVAGLHAIDQDPDMQQHHRNRPDSLVGFSGHQPGIEQHHIRFFQPGRRLQTFRPCDRHGGQGALEVPGA
jgi:hypothetical protein